MSLCYHEAPFCLWEVQSQNTSFLVVVGFIQLTLYLFLTKFWLNALPLLWTNKPCGACVYKYRAIRLTLILHHVLVQTTVKCKRLSLPTVLRGGTMLKPSTHTWQTNQTELAWKSMHSSDWKVGGSIPGPCSLHVERDQALNPKLLIMMLTFMICFCSYSSTFEMKVRNTLLLRMSMQLIAANVWLIVIKNVNSCPALV